MRASRARRIALFSVQPLLAACASSGHPPPATVLQGAAVAPSYSARLRVSLRGEELRGRVTALVGFRRPDGFRIEVPGPMGARLVAVANAERLVAVFPPQRAVFHGEASAAGFAALFGVELAPAEMMDLLLGVEPAGLRSYRVKWGPRAPRRIEAVLRDGTRLEVTAEAPVLGTSLAAAAFEAPAADGFRVIDAHEARSLWVPR